MKLFPRTKTSEPKSQEPIMPGYEYYCDLECPVRLAAATMDVEVTPYCMAERKRVTEGLVKLGILVGPAEVCGGDSIDILGRLTRTAATVEGDA